MAHCSFSFLMEPYSACREKSLGSTGGWCQVKGAAPGMERAHQASSGALEVKTAPVQFTLVQPWPGLDSWLV